MGVLCGFTGRDRLFFRGVVVNFDFGDVLFLERNAGKLRGWKIATAANVNLAMVLERVGGDMACEENSCRLSSKIQACRPRVVMFLVSEMFLVVE